MWWQKIKKDLSRKGKRQLSSWGSKKFVFIDERKCLINKSITFQVVVIKQKQKYPKGKTRKWPVCKWKNLKSLYFVQYKVEKQYAITNYSSSNLHPNESDTEKKQPVTLDWKSPIISQKYNVTIFSVLSFYDDIFILYRWLWLIHIPSISSMRKWDIIYTGKWLHYPPSFS